MTELLTLDEVADRLRVSRRQVDRYVASGRLRVIRLGWRSVRVRSTEVDAFIAACERRGHAA